MAFVMNDVSARPAANQAGSGFWQRFHAAVAESRRRAALRQARARRHAVDESGIVFGGAPTTTLPFAR